MPTRQPHSCPGQPRIQALPRRKVSLGGSQNHPSSVQGWAGIGESNGLTGQKDVTLPDSILSNTFPSLFLFFNKVGDQSLTSFLKAPVYSRRNASRPG